MIREFGNADPALLNPTDEEQRIGLIDVIPDQWEGVERAMRIMTDELEMPKKQIVVLVESNFKGALPTVSNFLSLFCPDLNVSQVVAHSNAQIWQLLTLKFITLYWVSFYLFS